MWRTCSAHTFMPNHANNKCEVEFNIVIVENYYFNENLWYLKLSELNGDLLWWTHNTYYH